MYNGCDRQVGTSNLVDFWTILKPESSPADLSFAWAVHNPYFNCLDPWYVFIVEEKYERNVHTFMTQPKSICEDHSLQFCPGLPKCVPR